MCLVPPDANRTGTGGQQVGRASAQLDSHYPETRCARRAKKAIFRAIEKTMHSWIKTHFQNGMSWHNTVDILHSERTGMEMDVPPLWFS